MAVSQMTRELHYPIQQVWSVVTNLEDTSWRSDLARVEVLSETTFVEYTKSGYATTFTVTACEKPTFWAFRMENENMSATKFCRYLKHIGPLFAHFPTSVLTSSGK